MTVQKLYVKSPYEGNGLKREFDITFDWLKGHQEHIKVYVRNGAGVLAETTNYKLEQDKSTEVWKVEYPAIGEPLAKGEKLIIVRELPLVQVLNLVNQGPFFAEDVELTFDEVVMMIQQLGEQVGRSLKFGVDIDAENEFDTTIPMVPGKTFRVNEAGTGFEVTEDPGLVYEKTVAEREAAEAAATTAQNASSVAKAWADEEAGATPSLIDGAKSSKQWADKANESAEQADNTLAAILAHDTPEYLIQVQDLLERLVDKFTDGTFQIDTQGNLMPKENPIESINWDIDDNGDIMPVEGVVA